MIWLMCILPLGCKIHLDKYVFVLFYLIIKSPECTCCQWEHNKYLLNKWINYGYVFWICLDKLCLDMYYIMVILELDESEFQCWLYHEFAVRIINKLA